MQKINGLSRTPHPYQIIAYVFFISLILSYYFIIFPLSAKTEKIVSIIIETIAGIGVIISGYLATSIDPSDPFLKLSRKARFENKPYEPPAREFYCGADHTYVKSTSKHCRRCARCTEEFDHHCKWINNDVGKANYKAFFMMISTVMVFLVAYLVFAIILTVNYANDNMLMTNDTYLYHDDKDRILAGMVILWIIMVPSAAFLILDTNLVLFHIFLKMKGLTTFQYITIVEERKEHMKELEEAIKMLGGNRKTCLDFVLCLRKRKPRDPNMNDKKDSAKTAEIELGRTSSFEKKKVSELLDDNKNENRSISKIGVEETPAPTPQIAHANSPSSKHHVDPSPNSSPNNPLNIYPVDPESPTKEREANISREVNYNGSEPVVVNISRENGKMRTSNKKHTISQISMEINKEEEEAQARHDIKILTPNCSKPRMSTYSMAGEEVPAVSNKNTRGSQIVEIKMEHVTSQNADLKRPKRSDSKRKESYNARNDDLEGKPESYRGAEL